VICTLPILNCAVVSRGLFLVSDPLPVRCHNLHT